MRPSRSVEAFRTKRMSRPSIAERLITNAVALTALTRPRTAWRAEQDVRSRKRDREYAHEREGDHGATHGTVQHGADS
jgi:hypothetical protein